MSGRQRRRRRLIACAIVLVATRLAIGDPLVDRLATDDLRALDAAVTLIERTPTAPDLAPALFVAARECEERLHDPGRALTLYDRILRELPDAGVAVLARRRAGVLRAEVGPHHEHAREAGELAALIAHAETLAPDEIVRRAEALAAATWPGAPDAALWLAEWLRRSGRLADAQRRYAAVTAGWPGTPQATTAIRGGAGCALDAHDWALAERLANELPRADPAEEAVRQDLLAAIDHGRWSERLYLAAWVLLAGVVALFALSLVEAARRGGWRRPPLRPPFEVLFLGPVAAVLIAIAFTAHRAIAPAVTLISLGGLVMAWLSGATLDLLRLRDRPVHLRALVHIVASIVGVAALGYIAMMRGGLLEMLVETVRFGPEP